MVSVITKHGFSVKPGEKVQSYETGLVARVTGISSNEVTIETSWGHVKNINKLKFSAVFIRYHNP